jgi:hypothetical protein
MMITMEAPLRSRVLIQRDCLLLLLHLIHFFGSDRNL